MSDLDAAVRAKLAEVESYMWGHYDLPYAEEMHAALLAVLDLHKPHPDAPDKCSCLPDWDDTYTAHACPCPTVCVIAEKLGVEVERG